MGGNTALQSGRRLQWVKGIILMTPYDPSYYLLHGQGERFRGLIEEGSVLQSDGLEAIYKDAAEIISDNCDSVLFLSGRGKNAKEISDALGKETIDSFNTSENRGSQTSHGLNYQKLGKSLPQCQVMNWCQIIYLEAIRAIQYNK